jgi:hypothetical protein
MADQLLGAFEHNVREPLDIAFDKSQDWHFSGAAKMIQRFHMSDFPLGRIRRDKNVRGREQKDHCRARPFPAFQRLRQERAGAGPRCSVSLCLSFAAKSCSFARLARMRKRNLWARRVERARTYKPQPLLRHRKRCLPSESNRSRELPLKAM